MPAETQQTRITVGLIRKAEDALADLAAATGMSKTDLVNRAVLLLHFVHETEDAGGQILTRSADGEIGRVHLL